MKLKIAIISIIILIISIFVYVQYISYIPESTTMNVIKEKYKSKIEKEVPGSAFVSTHLYLTDLLLNKRGGYTHNDLLEGLIFDNVSNWEFGVVQVLRDNSIILRKDFSRSQSQSLESKHLSDGQTYISYDASSWWFPSTESQYKKSYTNIMQYLVDITDNDLSDNANFYVRADNLKVWLDYSATKLGSLSQRLSASIKEERVNTDLAGDSEAKNSTEVGDEVTVKTPWLEIDDVFYEARGVTYSYLHLMKAIEYDFKEVLEKKNALPSLRQIIRELEAVQREVSPPIVLNGDGYGWFANHSLVAANYISRANAAIIDLKNLLENG